MNGLLLANGVTVKLQAFFGVKLLLRRVGARSQVDLAVPARPSNNRSNRLDTELGHKAIPTGPITGYRIEGALDDQTSYDDQSPRGCRCDSGHGFQSDRARAVHDPAATLRLRLVGTDTAGACE
ncbi:hypothetical protein R1A27_04890 [Methylobacterium sp. NMS12]|uniref:hypothetical protein n=1 Tax=Methylobacterium sp. NMS12 TaxID=3079766 RepID=UPI003F880A62